MNVLCEVNIGDEASKSGLPYDAVIPFLEQISKFEHIKVCGLMAIPPILEKNSTQKQYFQKITNLYIDIMAKKIDNIFNTNSIITFIIGGSYGLHNDIKKRSNFKLSFSKLTFPHQLFRVNLLEQIYRAYKINNNESYHK